MTNTDSIPGALVTGGSRAIGRATALALVNEGVDVVVTYLTGREEADTLVAEIETLGRKSAALRLDTTDIASFASFAAALREKLPHGPLDSLVNNAGTGFWFVDVPASGACRHPSTFTDAAFE